MTDYLTAQMTSQNKKSLLTCLTCGSVDDGKSTLIGRLLYDSNMLLEDQLAKLQQDSKKHGTQGKNLDFALLVDGLQAERAQGITIDVAYRFFETPKRKFILADTPGHIQYTRNMATGASGCQCAVLLVDAKQGVSTQTKRHAFIVRLFGIQHIILAVNKMDLVSYQQEKFNESVSTFNLFLKALDKKDRLTPLKSFTAIPISALKGDNITSLSPHMGFYKGKPLLAHLEQLKTEKDDIKAPLRLPIQWVARPHPEFRGFGGQIISGTLKQGDEIMVLPAGKKTKITSILLGQKELGAAHKGQSIMVCLKDELDISRGDLFASPKTPPSISNQFEAYIIWMGEDDMLAGRHYHMKIGTQFSSATLLSPKYKINIDRLDHLASKTLSLNDIGVCEIHTNKHIIFEPYHKNPSMGGFILIDKITNNTIAAGLLRFSLRRADNIHWQPLTLDKQAHAKQKGQKPAILWLTGLSGAGKSTIADELQKQLYQQGLHSFLLDGDNIRHGLSRDLGFTDKDRIENIRRIGEVAKLMCEAGLLVLTSFISPFRAERQMVRDLVAKDEFIEIFIDTALSVAEKRDPKGLYKKARKGELKNFTGIDSPYETPQNPEITIKTETSSPKQAALTIMKILAKKGIVKSP